MSTSSWITYQQDQTNHEPIAKWVQSDLRVSVHAEMPSEPGRQTLNHESHTIATPTWVLYLLQACGALWVAPRRVDCAQDATPRGYKVKPGCVLDYPTPLGLLKNLCRLAALAKR